MILTPKDLVFIAEDVNSPGKVADRQADYDRWLMYNGKTQEIIKVAIQKEFKKRETVEELISRLVPLNIIGKIINKLSGVYLEDPLREVQDQSESDQELLESYEDGMDLNAVQKEGNRYFKLFKRNLQRIFVDEEGIPGLRNLPRHTYEVYSFNSIRPNRPDVIAEIMIDSELKEDQRINVWSDESFKTIDGDGRVQTDVENLDGVNPMVTLPFVYYNEATYGVNPLQDDDLIKIAIAIPVVLTDLLFATKYQAWALIYTIGDVGDLPSNPSSVISMNYGPDGQKPEVGTIKPEIDIIAILQLVTNLLSTLLTTKNLSAGTIKTTQNVSETISGISKALDNSESVEDKKDQQSFFAKGEKDLWLKLSKFIIPYWRKNQLLAEDYNQEFSTAFEVSVLFREPKILLSEKERLDNSAFKLEKGFSTLKRELRVLNPDMSDAQIDQLEKEVKEEKLQLAEAQVEVINQEGEDDDQEEIEL